MSPPLIENVSDTARWVAYCRALESDRADALFRDPFARALAGERGRIIAEGMPPVPGGRPGPSGLAGVLAVRTVVFDEMILECIKSIGADAVLNLAAGLDARPYRLPLPPSLVWIEADQAEIFDDKSKVLDREKPCCTLERVVTNLANDEARLSLLDRVAGSYARVVVITEGLLAYLDEPVVASLAAELRSRPSIRKWVLESISPEVVERNMRAWGPILARANARWKFAPSDGLGFFRRHGWSPTVERGFFSEARRLGRDREVRGAWVVRALMRVSKRFRERLANAVVYGVVERSLEGVDV
jgi:methyltransferase (TIGR00027 family)